MRLKLEEIGFDDDISPRLPAEYTVKKYVNLLHGGAHFPPIEVQRLRYEDGIEKIICINGRHRLEAYRVYNNELSQQKLTEKVLPIENVGVTFWKDDCISKEEYFEPLLIHAAKVNDEQGKTLSDTDLGSQILKILKNRKIDELKGFVTVMSNEFKRGKSTISEMDTSEGTVSQVLAKRRMSRDVLIYRLSLLGRSNVEIGETFNLGEHAIREIRQKFGSEQMAIVEEYEKGIKTPEDIATYKSMDIATTWAVLLNNNKDKERFTKFGTQKLSNTQPLDFDVWNFIQRDTRLGKTYAGNIPGQIVMNVLYRYTKQDNLVVDPMAGGGVTLDTCLVMNRKCRAYDKEPVTDEIQKWNVGTGYPDECKNCDLIFLDPPYYKKKEKDYGEESVSALSREQYLVFFDKLAHDSYLTLRPKGYLAFLMSNYIDYKTPEESIFVFDYYKCFISAGFTPIIEIQCPLSTEQYTGFQVNQAKALEKILVRSRSLFIFQKIERGSKNGKV